MTTHALYGAIYGDIIGRKYEYKYEGEIPEDLDMFPKDGKISDDTIMTLASALAINTGIAPEEAYKLMGNKYLEGYGYGKNFIKWLKGEECFRNSYGNGCLMRLSPFLWSHRPSMYLSSIICTHNSDDAIISCYKLGKLYYEPADIILKDISFPKGFFIHAFDTYQIIEKISYLEFNSLEDVVKFTVCLGGDTDTNASIAAELFNFRNPEWLTPKIKTFVEIHLDDFQLNILKQFNNE